MVIVNGEVILKKDSPLEQCPARWCADRSKREAW
jgi:hypothetical protein